MSLKSCLAYMKPVLLDFHTMVPSNKPRLYIALYARGGVEQDTYHWALISGPKTETDTSQGKRYHVRQRQYTENGDLRTRWEYEELEIPTAPTRMVLVRITVAKIVKSERMQQILRGVPIVQNDANWTCRIWVRDALASLAADEGVLGTSITLWATVENTAKQYVRRKKDQHRFDGQVQWDMEKVPTWDLIENKETVP
ncbi:hypothetical protein FQN54_005619 [Arachnomyces sp. PD_36]|nr:hypothetical protein FQN54_005619 [Arachnomyces sp. PD_36]